MPAQLALGLSRRKPLKFPNIGANCPSKLRGEALALRRDAAFWTVALHSTGEGPVPGRAPPNQAVWTSEIQINRSIALRGRRRALRKGATSFPLCAGSGTASFPRPMADQHCSAK
jgi:hypothetical protein